MDEERADDKRRNAQTQSKPLKWSKAPPPSGADKVDAHEAKEAKQAETADEDSKVAFRDHGDHYSIAK
jgi:hypothetical protein